MLFTTIYAAIEEGNLMPGKYSAALNVTNDRISLVESFF